MSIKATIEERGNGFPDVGDYVAGRDGEVYRLVSRGSHIQTQAPGAPNIIPECTVELADWSDVDDDTAPVCSAIIEDGKEPW